MYIPDHLGTSTFLTDANGNAYQFFLNLPFGETMAEQLGTSYYKSPYKFNGKELDEETGLYYYGARYYNPKTSIWLSVDPLAEQGPNWSPYCYTFNNPINLVDPDGRWPDLPSWGSIKKSYNEAKATVARTYNETKSSATRSYNQATKYVKQKTEEIKSQVSVATEKTLNYMDTKAAGTKEFAKGMQNGGDIAVGAGAIVTLSTGATGVGAVIGGGLMTAGAATSLGGSILESAVDLYVAGRNGEINADNAFKTIGLEVVGKVAEIGLKKVLPGYGTKLAQEGADAVMNNAVKATVKMNEVALDRTVGAVIEKKE